jgi:glutathione peroxidase-family protein
VDVNGPHAHPVYQYLKRELPVAEGGGGGHGTGKDLVWNFQKVRRLQV